MNVYSNEYGKAIKRSWTKQPTKGSGPKDGDRSRSRLGSEQRGKPLVQSNQYSVAFQVQVFLAQCIGTKLLPTVGIEVDNGLPSDGFFDHPKANGGRSGLPNPAGMLLNASHGSVTGLERIRSRSLPKGRPGRKGK
jgi:hypothetical protein